MVLESDFPYFGVANVYLHVNKHISQIYKSEALF